MGTYNLVQYVKKFGQIGKFYALPGRWQWLFNFSNGYGVSVIGGKWVYGDGIDTFEVALVKKGKICHNDVYEYLTEQEVEDLLNKVQRYKDGKTSELVKEIDEILHEGEGVRWTVKTEK